MLTDDDIRGAARRLYEAENERKLAKPLSSAFENATLEDAYRVGLAVKELKASSGSIVKGHKIGLTSKPMQDMSVRQSRISASSTMTFSYQKEVRLPAWT